MADTPSHTDDNLSEVQSGDQLGGLMAPAESASTHTGQAPIESDIDLELAEIISEITALDDDDGAASDADAGEATVEAEGADPLLDDDGVLMIELPDEAPPPIDLSADAATPVAMPAAAQEADASEQPDDGADDASAAVAESGEDDGAAGADSDADADTPRPGRRRRRRRNPFESMEPVSSSAAGMNPRDPMTLSEMKQIKRARVRHDGQRVITDDVKKLKSLTTNPHLPPGEYINYYVEPVRIEYYIPKESRFAVETRFLYIPLIDPAPRPEVDDRVLKAHIEQNRFIDIVDIMNEFPMFITDILESYNTTMGLYESLSRAIQEADEGNDEGYRKAFYLCEVLTDYEPTMASLNFLGDFLGWNLNWLIRAMNALGMEFAASDKTISYLIKKRNTYWEETNQKYDDRFETLAALFYEQAFPNRGLEDMEEDYFYDIFDKKFTM